MYTVWRCARVIKMAARSEAPRSELSSLPTEASTSVQSAAVSSLSELIVWSTDYPSQAEQHQKQQYEPLAQRAAEPKPSEKHNGETSTRVAKNKKGRRKKKIASTQVESAASTTATNSEQGDKDILEILF